MTDLPLTPEAIAAQLEPYLSAAPADSSIAWPLVFRQLAFYLELILKWNARVNLTAIRTPEEIVRRHFGESLFAGLHLASHHDARPMDSLLDFGSGAGLPGIPIQLLYPALPVTLAESRSRKAAFLQEVGRSLGLSSEVWAGRVEAMPLDRRFHTVILRAVDDMSAAVAEAAHRARSRIAILGTRRQLPAVGPGFVPAHTIPLPHSDDGALFLANRQA